MTNKKSTKAGGKRSGKTIPPAEGQVESPILTENEVKQVWDFYQFARNLNNPMALTPMLLNQRMQDITFNPLAVDQSTLDAAIKDPKNSETQLMQISEYFEMVSQPYKRLIAYLGNMLSFDLVMTPLNADKTDYGTVAFKKDQRLVESFLDGFDYQKEFRIRSEEHTSELQSPLNL